MTNGSGPHKEQAKKKASSRRKTQTKSKKVTAKSLAQDTLTRGVQTPPPDYQHGS